MNGSEKFFPTEGSSALVPIGCEQSTAKIIAFPDQLGGGQHAHGHKKESFKDMALVFGSCVLVGLLFLI